MWNTSFLKTPQDGCTCSREGLLGRGGLIGLRIFQSFLQILATCRSLVASGLKGLTKYLELMWDTCFQ